MNLLHEVSMDGSLKNSRQKYCSFCAADTQHVRVGYLLTAGAKHTRFGSPRFSIGKRFCGKSDSSEQDLYELGRESV